MVEILIVLAAVGANFALSAFLLQPWASAKSFGTSANKLNERSMNMEWSYIVRLVKNAVDAFYRGEEGVYQRTAQVLPIRGISAKTLGEIEEMYYASVLGD